MMRGRKPSSTHLKLVKGNPGKRPVNDAEPVPKGDLFEPPVQLTDSQREIWSHAIADAPVGLLKKLDASVVLTWVVACDLHRQATAEVARHGMVIQGAGAPYQNPHLSILNRQAMIMIRAAEQLGFTPSSRSRVKVTPYNPDTLGDNPYAEFG